MTFPWPARLGSFVGGTSWSAAGALAGFLLFAATLPAQAPLIHVDVNLVRVVATVRNPAGDLVGTLHKDDFQLFDNGVRQEIAVFERQTNQPLSVALMMDVSGSTAKELRYEIDSGSRFLRSLLTEGNPEDAVALYTFDYQVTRDHYFTHNQSSIAARLKTIHGSAGTSLYDAIYLASRDLEEREGRKVMVVVTDGGDTTSSKDSHKALEAAQLADAVIYPIVVMPITNDAGRNIGGENALTFMAQGTGGRPFLPSLGAQLDRAFADIIDELRTEYLLGYYPHDVPPTKERFHRLEVRVKSPGLRVSARNGYYGEFEGAAGPPESRIDVKPERTVKPDGKKKRQN